MKSTANRSAVQAFAATDLIGLVDDVFRASFSFYYRAHAAHWNVTGMLFGQFHELFETMYSDVLGSLDDLAESLRRLGAFAPQQIGPLGAAGPIESDATALSQALLADNDALLTKLAAALVASETAGEQGVLNLLAERQFAHEKFRWMLKATLA